MQNARTDDGVQRQVVDVTGSEWTPNICYAGNAMLRRSRRIQSKEQIIGNITAEQNTGKILKDGTSTVPQITGKRPGRHPVRGGSRPGNQAGRDFVPKADDHAAAVMVIAILQELKSRRR